MDNYPLSTLFRRAYSIAAVRPSVCVFVCVCVRILVNSIEDKVMIIETSNLPQMFPMWRGWTLLVFKVKGQGHSGRRLKILVNSIEDKCSPWGEDEPYWSSRSRIKGQGHCGLRLEIKHANARGCYACVAFIQNHFWIIYECVSTWNVPLIFPIYRDYIPFMYIEGLHIHIDITVSQLHTLHLYAY